MDMRLLLKPSLFALVVSISACSIVDHRSDVSYGKAGELVSSELVSQIKPGHTRKAWVLSHLGEPTSLSMAADGEELYTYSYEKVAEKRLRVIFLFQTRSTKTDNKHLYISLKDGIVTKFWKDFSYDELFSKEPSGEPINAGSVKAESSKEAREQSPEFIR